MTSQSENQPPITSIRPGRTSRGRCRRSRRGRAGTRPCRCARRCGGRADRPCADGCRRKGARWLLTDSPAISYKNSCWLGRAVLARHGRSRYHWAPAIMGQHVGKYGGWLRMRPDGAIPRGPKALLEKYGWSDTLVLQEVDEGVVLHGRASDRPWRQSAKFGTIWRLPSRMVWIDGEVPTPIRHLSCRPQSAAMR